MPNATYGTDGLLATTLKHYIPTLADNVFTSKPLLWVLKNAARIQNQEGGEKIVQPLVYGLATNKGSYSGADPFTTNPNSGISAVEFPWKQYYGLFSMEGIEMAKNRGRSALLSLLDARLQQLELTMSEELEIMFFGDGSGNAGKDMYGLECIIDASDPSWGDFGGIDRTAASGAYWRSTETGMGGALTVAAMVTLYNTISEGNDHPTNIFTTATLHAKYESLIQANQRFEDPKMADAGFQNLMFKGTPMAYSANCTATYMYFVNMKYIWLKYLSGVWFKPSEMRAPTNQDVWYKHILCYANLIASNCKRHGKLTGATA